MTKINKITLSGEYYTHLQTASGEKALLWESNTSNYCNKYYALIVGTKTILTRSKIATVIDKLNEY